MDLTKFISILDSSCLFFPRVDKLEDPFEGIWPVSNLASQGFTSQGITNDEQVKIFYQQDKAYENYQDNIKLTAISCWHLNESESDAMWKLYIKNNEGIAIQSTYQSFKNCFKNDDSISLGMVNYIDYENDYIDVLNNLSPFFYKRKCFSHEKEIRALISRISTSEQIENGGISVKVNLNNLVENIYVSPTSPEWFLKVINSIVKKYGYNFKVIQSNLYNSPEDVNRIY